jgi:hypothetical protein
MTTTPDYLTEAHVSALTGFAYTAVRRVLREKVQPCLEIRQVRGVTRVYAANRFDEIHTALVKSLDPHAEGAPTISRRKK